MVESRWCCPTPALVAKSPIGTCLDLKKPYPEVGLYPLYCILCQGFILQCCDGQDSETIRNSAVVSSGFSNKIPQTLN